MTQTCTERDGLTHAVFLRRLAGAHSATSADARLGNGAFLALRLVDLLGPERGPAHADAFTYQHAATYGMPPEFDAFMAGRPISLGRETVTGRAVHTCSSISGCAASVG